MVNTENVVETVTTTFGGINSNFDQNQHKKANQMEFSTLCHQYRLGPSPQICFLGPPTCSTVELEAGKAFFCAVLAGYAAFQKFSKSWSK